MASSELDSTSLCGVFLCWERVKDLDLARSSLRYPARRGCADDLKMPRLGTGDCLQGDAPVEGHKPAAIGNGKAQEVGIRELAVPLDVGRLEEFPFTE